MHVPSASDGLEGLVMQRVRLNGIGQRARQMQVAREGPGTAGSRRWLVLMGSGMHGGMHAHGQVFGRHKGRGRGQHGRCSSRASVPSRLQGG